MIAHWVAIWIGRFSYPAVFLLLLSAGLGVPISEDLVVLTGGTVIARTHGSLVLMIAVVYLGKLSGDFCLFRIGWRLGPHAVESRHFKRMLTPDRVAKVDRFFGRYGVGAVILARFLPGLRAPTYLVAGISRFSPWKFVAADGLAALVSAPLVTWLGYHFGDRALEWMEHSGRWMALAGGAVVLAALAVGIWWHRRKRPRASLTRPPAGITEPPREK
jgi:membrane protein DedA with SNARE-associated domain